MAPSRHLASRPSSAEPHAPRPSNDCFHSRWDRAGCRPVDRSEPYHRSPSWARYERHAASCFLAPEGSRLSLASVANTTRCSVYLPSGYNVLCQRIIPALPIVNWSDGSGGRRPTQFMQAQSSCLLPREINEGGIKQLRKLTVTS